MSSLRASIARLPRFSPGTLNLGEVAEFVHLERPLSVRALAATVDALPDVVPFHAQIVTDGPFGGAVTLELGKSGSYRFRGFMRATGVPSFSYRLGAVVRSASGQVMVAVQHSGKVFGTDTPGNRQDDWDEVGVDPQRTKLIRNVWPDISAGTMVVKQTAELGGVLGTAVDVVKDVAEFFVAAQTLGVALTICLVIGSELGDAGVPVPGLGGIVGLGVVGGSLFIWGPYSIGPAILLGVAAGAVVESMVKIRKLTREEEDFANQVFAGSIDFARVRLTNLLGIGGRPFTMPTVDDTILINIGDGPTYDTPTRATKRDKYPGPGQLFIHELTHAWQIQHATVADGYVPGAMCELIGEQATLGRTAYDYGPAGPPWSSFHGEAQAAIVDDWFAGNGDDKPAQDKDSPYFRYISDNIRLGVG